MSQIKTTCSLKRQAVSNTPKMPGEVTCEHGDWADFCRFCWMKYAHALKHALDDKEREVAKLRKTTIEECAKVCEEVNLQPGWVAYPEQATGICAAAIRALKGKP